MNLKSKKGFTLVELIIVIAILGIIALIAVPSLTGVQKRSQVNADTRTAEQIGKSVRVWLTDGNINQQRIRENYINTTNYRELSTINKTSVPDTTTDANDNGLEDYIALTYEPNVTDEEDGKLAFYVGLINGKVVVSIAKDGQTKTLAGITAIYELDSDSKVVPGIAYIEGLSNLSEKTPIKNAIGIEVTNRS